MTKRMRIARAAGAAIAMAAASGALTASAQAGVLTKSATDCGNPEISQAFKPYGDSSTTSSSATSRTAPTAGC